MSYLGGITPSIQGLRITGTGSALLSWTRHTWAKQHAPCTRGGLNKQITCLLQARQGSSQELADVQTR